MNIILWVVQVVLALMFLMAGVMKATRPINELAKRMRWVEGVSPGLVRFVGVSEILGAIGLVLPGLAHFAPWLTVAAGIGLAVVMVLAAQLHMRLGERSAIRVNGILFLLALVVVVGRAMLPV
ncbi:MAG: DoxX family protein [Thermaerobacter sp.]|nr:DoxX family protein [Thermaerobacter sp.]